MGAGHFAAALALGRAERRINVGFLFLAAMFADVLLGVFVLLGLEEAHVPPSYAIRHYLEYTFPYSHGLLATAVWATLAFLVARVFWSTRVALIVGAAVLSHFPLDVLVHVREVPIAGEESYKVGYGLWNHLGIELTLEAVMVVVALVLFGRRGMAVFVGILTTVMIGAQAMMNTAPRTTTLAAQWIAAGILISAIAFVLDRRRSKTVPNT